MRTIDQIQREIGMTIMVINNLQDQPSSRRDDKAIARQEDKLAQLERELAAKGGANV